MDKGARECGPGGRQGGVTESAIDVWSLREKKRRAIKNN